MSQELSTDTKLVAADGAITSQVDDEKVVLQTETETYYGVGGVGTRAWELLERGPHTVGELRATIAEEYDADPERVRRDIDAFVADLHEKSLVETVGDGRE